MIFSEMILDLADEDYVGLWELLWRGKTVAPDMESGALEGAVQQCTRELIDKGLLQLYRGVTFSGEESPVPHSEVGRVLQDASAWSPPVPSAVHVRVTVTKAGEQAYRTSTA